MLTSRFQDKELSLLGFGAMRLPTLPTGEIDENQVAEMVQMAMEQGVNYFDTAYPYHGGMSEGVMGRVLSKYPRETWYLADKYPGHQIADTYDPAAVFEDQLRKCGVEYFDFYLLHNVYEHSMDVYLDPQWGILDYFREQKRLGRIKHLGFSTHGRLENLRAFLDAAGDDMEFCQIQLNWLDWTLQEAKEKVELLNERNIPVWVMEPVRGGRLCKLNHSEMETLKSLRPDESIAAWSFRFLQDIPGVTMILSGMSNIEQMKDNLHTFEEAKPLSDAERQTLFNMAEGMKKSVPCTGCGYCLSVCPLGLDIPTLLATFNELRFAPVTNASMLMEFLPAQKQPAACIGCAQCMQMCPQSISIPVHLRELSAILRDMPKWADISRERAEAAKRAMGK